MKKETKIIILLLFMLLSACTDIRNKFSKKTGNVREGKEFYSLEEDMNNSNKTGKLRIALLLPLSGPIKPIGDSILNAAQLSLFKNGKKNILLRAYDTKGTTFGATQAINKAIYEGVDVILGPLFAAETQSIKNIAKKNNIIIFSLSNEQDLRNLDNVFIISSIPEQEINLLISYMMKENDISNFVSLMPNNQYGANINKILRAAIVGKDGLLIKSDYYETKEKVMMTKISELTNYYEVPQTLYEEYQKRKAEQKLLGNSAEIPFIIKEEEKIYPKALFIADGGKVAENIASLLFMTQREGEKIQLLGISKMDGDNNLLNNPYMEGVIFVGADPNKYEEYSEDYKSIYLEDPIKLASVVYDFINIADKIYKKKNGDEFLIDKVELLNPYGFDGIDGKFRFLPNGLVERNSFILKVESKKKVILFNIPEFLNY